MQDQSQKGSVRKIKNGNEVGRKRSFHQRRVPVVMKTVKEEFMLSLNTKVGSITTSSVDARHVI